jgi:hypothetical protein
MWCEVPRGTTRLPDAISDVLSILQQAGTDEVSVSIPDLECVLHFRRIAGKWHKVATQRSRKVANHEPRAAQKR